MFEMHVLLRSVALNIEERHDLRKGKLLVLCLSCYS